MFRHAIVPRTYRGWRGNARARRSSRQRNVERSTHPRRWRSLLTGGLVAGVVLALAPAAEAAKPCSVTNRDTGVRYGSSLQLAIDEAAAGNTLQVRGRCVGTFAISVDLSLAGASKRGSPVVTLDGIGLGPVLIVNASTVTLTDLRITGAGAVAGILNYHGTLILSGSSTVSGNASPLGAGIYNNQGTVALLDTASVSGNTASGPGGGIYNHGDPNSGRPAWLFLLGSSTVIGNTSGGSGGGIYNDSGGFVEMYDASSASLVSTVMGNRAGGSGGGIYNAGGVLLNVLAFPTSGYNVYDNDPDDVYP